jgi:hypothetical protein
MENEEFLGLGQWIMFALLCIVVDQLRALLYRKVFDKEFGDEIGEWCYRLHDYGLPVRILALVFFPVTTVSAMLHLRPKFLQPKAHLQELILKSKLHHFYSWIAVYPAFYWSVIVAPIAILYLMYKKYGTAIALGSWIMRIFRGI